MIPDAPLSLFKYFGPERLDVISDQLLRFTPLGDFNDPFEGRPEVTGLTLPNEMMTIFDQIIPEEVKKIYDNLPLAYKETVSYRHLYALARAQLEEKKESILNSVQSFTPIISGFINGKLDENLGAFCLSEVPDSLLMWAHYGASHTGFVLEFDGSHPYFHQQITDDDELRRIRRVSYRETRPSSCLAEMSAIELFLVKSGHWAYEREWRMIRPLQDADKVLEKQPFPVHLYSYPLQALKAIIIGARATTNTTRQIREIVSQGSAYSHIQIKQSLPDASHFHLRISTLDGLTN